MSYRYANVRGTGGWLAFFIATLVVGALLLIGTGAMVLVSAHTFTGGQHRFALTLAAVALVHGCLDAAMAARLQFSRARSTPRLVIAGLWIGVLMAAVSQFLGPHWALGLSPRVLVPAMLTAFVRGGLYAAIWTAYLLRSARVANTYGTHPDLIAAFE